MVHLLCNNFNASPPEIFYQIGRLAAQQFPRILANWHFPLRKEEELQKVKNTCCADMPFVSAHLSKDSVLSKSLLQKHILFSIHPCKTNIFVE